MSLSLFSVLDTVVAYATQGSIKYEFIVYYIIATYTLFDNLQYFSCVEAYLPPKTQFLELPPPYLLCIFSLDACTALHLT